MLVLLRGTKALQTVLVLGSYGWLELAKVRVRVRVRVGVRVRTRARVRGRVRYG